MLQLLCFPWKERVVEDLTYIGLSSVLFRSYCMYSTCDFRLLLCIPVDARPSVGLAPTLVTTLNLLGASGAPIHGIRWPSSITRGEFTTNGRDSSCCSWCTSPTQEPSMPVCFSKLFDGITEIGMSRADSDPPKCCR